MGGLRFLHVGDTSATAKEFAAYDLAAMEIDVAMLPFWILTSDDWPAYAKAIDADHIVAMHVPASSAPPSYFDLGAANQQEHVKRLITKFPDAIVFWEPGQKHRYREGKREAP